VCHYLPDRMMNRNQFCAVGKCSFYLNFVHHFRHAFHHVIPFQNRRAIFHEFGDRAAVADSFKQVRGDESYRFGVIQAQSARPPFARKFCRRGDHQFFNFSWREMHFAFSTRAADKCRALANDSEAAGD